MILLVIFDSAWLMSVVWPDEVYVSALDPS